jgi:hypothetical protein
VPTIEEKTVKRLLAVIAAACTLSATADVAEVRQWQPAPGRAAEMVQAAEEARAIHTKLGATVWIGVDQNGILHYATSFKDWSAWAAFITAANASAEWQSFWQKYSVANPNSTNIATFHLNVPVAAKTQAVTMVYSWDVRYEVPGAFDTFMATAQKSIALHTALGASAGVNVDEIGNVHYELSFESWAAWAKFSAALDASQEWADLLKDAYQNPTAELVKVYMIDTIPAP